MIKERFFAIRVSVHVVTLTMLCNTDIGHISIRVSTAHLSYSHTDTESVVMLIV